MRRLPPIPPLPPMPAMLPMSEPFPEPRESAIPEWFRMLVRSLRGTGIHMDSQPRPGRANPAMEALRPYYPALTADVQSRIENALAGIRGHIEITSRDAAERFVGHVVRVPAFRDALRDIPAETLVRFHTQTSVLERILPAVRNEEEMPRTQHPQDEADDIVRDALNAEPEVIVIENAEGAANLSDSGEEIDLPTGDPGSNPVPTTVEQMVLLPEEIETGDLENVALTDLPPNGELKGPEPDLSFIHSVKRVGVLQPVVLVRTVDGGFVVAAGRRRIKAARLAKLSTVPALIFSSEWTPVDVLTLIENAHRRDNPISELLAIENILAHSKEDGTLWTDKELAKELGIPLATVQKRRQMLNLHPTLRKALGDKKMAFGVATDASKLPMNLQRELVKRLEYHGVLTGDDVTEVRQVGAVEATEVLPDFLFEAPQNTERTPAPADPAPSTPAAAPVQNNRRTAQSALSVLEQAQWHLTEAETLLAAAGEDGADTVSTLNAVRQGMMRLGRLVTRANRA